MCSRLVFGVGKGVLHTAIQWYPHSRYLEEGVSRLS